MALGKPDEALMAPAVQWGRHRPSGQKGSLLQLMQARANKGLVRILGLGQKGVLRLAVASLARLERVLEGAGRLQWEAGCWGAPMPQGCSGSLGGGLSPHPPPGVALGGTVLPALAHRRSGKCTGTSGGLRVGAASSPTRPSSELRDLTSWGSLFSSSLLGFLCTTTQKFLDLRRCRGTEGRFRRSGLTRTVKPSELC